MMRREPQCGIKTGGLHPTALLVGKIESRATWLPPRLREPDHTHSVPICSVTNSPPLLLAQVGLGGGPQGERWVRDRWAAEKEDSPVTRCP